MSVAIFYKKSQFGLNGLIGLIFRRCTWTLKNLTLKQDTILWECTTAEVNVECNEWRQNGRYL